MNKRIRKKRLRNNERVKFEATRDIISEIVHSVIFSRPVEDGMFPIGPFHYRTYLKKRGLNKRHTQLGSRTTKYVKF